ncbi:HNH endonuclease [Pedobacter helvus]|uniref:HNH endonuclease n=1 Tax=Pedobacter helvus TaxID=2563444 RepID=A0ABW9JKP3_9SPHI|nr:HNH endonuclease domain-containing protein [Pedobacter ureilyticus]
MKRIKIDKFLIQAVKDLNVNLFCDKRLTGGNAFVLPKKKIFELYKKLNCPFQKSYLFKIYKEYIELLDLKPSDFAQKKQEFDNIFKIDGVKGSVSTLFGKKVVEALRYEDYRDSQYPKIVNDLGWNLKTCFYCNYAGTLTLSKGIKKYKTFYDLDHILPKSTYPFLATSFFNFIPSCAPCNRSKSSKIINKLNPFYEIGENNITLNKIFEITDVSKVNFYLKNDKEAICIKIASQINQVNRKEFDEVVDLELLYNSQKHIAEEILWKKRIYSKAYIKFIRSNFSALHVKRNDINRILWGTDLNEETVNDEPLAKFKFDLINDR